MDTLSRLIDLVAPRGRMELRCLFGDSFEVPHDQVGPWRAPFHIVLRGEFELWLPQTRELLPLRAGSLVVLPRGASHTLRSAAPHAQEAGDMPARRIRTVQGDVGDVVDVKTNLAPGARADVEILCGEFEFHGRRRSVLLEALPERMVVEFGDRPEFGWLEGLVRMMAHEIEQRSAGAVAIVGELSGALFTLAVRAHLETRPEQAGMLGLLGADRLAPSLAAMMEAPQHPWTVESLADLCHLSRASFARQFKQHAGSGPLELLTTLRMELAARLLAQGAQDTATIGEAVGYRSEAAFNRAFARHAGSTPGRYRRTAGES